MVTLKPPKNVFTSLEIDAGTDINTAIFAPAVLTTAEINSIPLDDLRAGGIVYNITVGSLQTYTINGWENITVGGGGSDPVFDNITVNDTATITSLVGTAANIGTINSLGTATIANINSSGTANIANITSSGTITGFNINATGTIGVAGSVILSSLGVSSTDIYAAGTIYGMRPSGAFHFFNNGTTFVFSGTQSKLNLTTTTDYLNQFTSPVAGRLTYTSIGQQPITVLIIFNFSGIYSATGTIELSIFKNGSVPIITGPTFNTTATQYSAASLSAITTLNLNDYVEVFVSGTAGTFSFLNYNMTVTQI